jgi:hypothetical protein
MQFSLLIGAETSAFAVVSATAASAGLFGCSNVCFNRRIQDQFQFQKTENGIEIAETPCQANISFNVLPSSECSFCCHTE